MPLYEYACPECGRTLECLVSSSDAAAPACPACGKPMKKAWSAFHTSGGGSGKSPGGGCGHKGHFS